MSSTANSSSLWALWIDRSQAKLFEFSNEKMERRTLQSGHPDLGPYEREFFRKIASLISNADRVLVLGPGVAKHHFCSYLREHAPALSRKLAGCETLEHPTDQQIAAMTRRFFTAGGHLAS